MFVDKLIFVIRWVSRNKHNETKPFGKVLSHYAFGAIPANIVKGKKMPGHYGNENITVQNLEIIDVIEDKNLLLVKGAVPGHKNTLVNINKALKKTAVKKK